MKKSIYGWYNTTPGIIYWKKKPESEIRFLCPICHGGQSVSYGKIIEKKEAIKEMGRYRGHLVEFKKNKYAHSGCLNSRYTEKGITTA